MKAHGWVVGTLASVATMAASSAVPPSRPAASLGAPTAGRPLLHLAGTRSLQQRESGSTRKLDSALADLSGHLAQLRADHVIEDLYALNPAARFWQRSAAEGPLVLVDAVTTGDPKKLKSALVSLGMQHAVLYSNDVGGWLPLSQLSNAAARAEVHSIRASMSRTRAGAVTSQGDFAQNSAALRSTYSTLNGTGVMVGIMSDSYDCYAVYAEPSSNVPASGPTGYAPNGFTATAATDVSTGDLPSSVTLVSTTLNGTTDSGEFPCLSYGKPMQTPFSDEGRAMMQVVHDVAPGASLAFHSAEYSEADFAAGVAALAAAGATVIADDVGYFDEPFFQDGLIAQAIDTVEGKGVAYFSAAGNNADHAWESTSPSFPVVSNTAPTTGEHLLNFDTTRATTKTTLSVDIPGLQQGELMAIILQWDQPYVTGAPDSGGATSQIDLCVGGAGSNTVINTHGTAEACTGLNSIGSDPVQVLIIDNPANAPAATAATTLAITVGLGSSSSPPGRIRVVVDDGGAGATFDPSVATNSPTLQGHPGAAGAAAVGAAAFFHTPACGISPATLEDYSALGGAPILFDSAGTRMASPTVRQKPDFVGPDGGNNTFLGFQLKNSSNPNFKDNSTVAQCQNNASFPNFFGTSAATPHAAAIAALMLQANPALTPSQIYDALRHSALAMGGATPNFNSGFGFIQADAALKLLPPGLPSLSFSPASVTEGGSATLTWSSINTASCTASGSWSGTQKTSGSAMITAPMTAGDAAYTLTCSNTEGSAAATVHLTVMAPPKSGGGGGALDELTALVLAALGCGRLLLRRAEPAVSSRKNRGP